MANLEEIKFNDTANHIENNTNKISERSLSSATIDDVHYFSAAASDNRYYTQTEIDDRYYQKTEVYNKTEIDEKIKSLYPINSIYLSTSNTNPKNLFNFGEWEQVGQGRCIVGAGTGTDSERITKEFKISDNNSNNGYFNSQLKEHSHEVSAQITSTATDGEHRHHYNDPPLIGGDWGPIGALEGSSFRERYDVWINSTSSAHSHQITIPKHNTETAGTSEASNLQPYFVVYIWQRIS